MLMMRLQRVGRKNDPAYRIVVTDKRTGVKSDKHVDRIGSYNPKLNQVQIDAEKAKEWLSKGVQPSDTMHNLLVTHKVIEGKKINVLPKKSPIVNEEAEETSEESTEETPAEEPVAEEVTEEKTEEAKKKTEEVEVEVAADEDDPTDRSETAEEDPEKVAEEKLKQAQALTDAEGD